MNAGMHTPLKDRRNLGNTNNQNNLFKSIFFYLLVEDGLGLTSETFLLGVVSSLTLIIMNTKKIVDQLTKIIHLFRESSFKEST